MKSGTYFLEIPDYFKFLFKYTLKPNSIKEIKKESTPENPIDDKTAENIFNQRLQHYVHKHDNMPRPPQITVLIDSSPSLKPDTSIVLTKTILKTLNDFEKKCFQYKNGGYVPAPAGKSLFINADQYNIDKMLYIIEDNKASAIIAAGYENDIIKILMPYVAKKVGLSSIEDGPKKILEAPIFDAPLSESKKRKSRSGHGPLTQQEIKQSEQSPISQQRNPSTKKKLRVPKQPQVINNSPGHLTTRPLSSPQKNETKQPGASHHLISGLLSEKGGRPEKTSTPKLTRPLTLTQSTQQIALTPSEFSSIPDLDEINLLDPDLDLLFSDQPQPGSTSSSTFPPLNPAFVDAWSSSIQLHLNNKAPLDSSLPESELEDPLCSSSRKRVTL